MTLFDTSTGAYSPWLALLLGALTWASWLGVGTAALSLGRVRVAPAWAPLVAVVTGALAVGWVVQVLAFSGLCSRDALFGVFVIALALGGWFLAGTWRRPGGLAELADASTFYYALPALVCAVAALVVAMAPTDQGEALAGHIFATQRLVQDGTWRLYLHPLAASAPIAMMSVFMAAPLHGLGHAEAAAVAELGVWFTFLFGFARAFIGEGDGSVAWRRWSWLGLAALGCSPAAVEGYAVGGGVAVGDAALAALACYLARPPRDDGQRAQAVTVGVLAAAAASASLAHAPLALLALGIGARRSGQAGGMWSGVLAVAPTMLVVVPGLIVTAWATGSPLGPWLGVTLGAEAWTAPELTRGLEFATDRSGHTAGLVAIFVGVFNNPLVWVGAIGFLVAGARGRAVIGALLVVQIGMFVAWLPLEPQLLCGLHYAAVLLLAVEAPPALQARFTSPTGVAWVAALLLLPWALMGVRQALPYAQVATGLENPEEWYGEHVRLHAAWTSLDGVLPADAGLLTVEPWLGTKIAPAYAPRPLFLDARDVPADFGGPIHLMVLGGYGLEVVEARVGEFGGGSWRLGELVLEVADAWRVLEDPRTQRMRVWRLERGGGSY